MWYRAGDTVGYGSARCFEGHKKANPHLSHWEVRICANLNNNLNFTFK